ncbi:hypothetical protein C8R47DRAFT_196149 [Mycena vitilis]|nr:hypothetical protein C8R47DRAFT_196149 [Mycena vitilis]
MTIPGLLIPSLAMCSELKADDIRRVPTAVRSAPATIQGLLYRSVAASCDALNISSPLRSSPGAAPTSSLKRCWHTRAGSSPRCNRMAATVHRCRCGPRSGIRRSSLLAPFLAQEQCSEDRRDVAQILQVPPPPPPVKPSSAVGLLPQLASPRKCCRWYRLSSGRMTRKSGAMNEPLNSKPGAMNEPLNRKSGALNEPLNSCRVRIDKKAGSREVSCRLSLDY